MIWTTWRQHRPTFLALILGFAACAVWIGVHGLQAHALYNQFMSQHCLGIVSAECDRLRGEQHGDESWIADLLPWLIAIFVGAPLAVRDFETGSYRFSATQRVSLRRQAAARLLLLGTVIVVPGSLLGLLATWSISPLQQYFYGWTVGGRFWIPGSVSVTVFLLPAFSLLDFCLGATIGVLIRRTLPAMAVTALAVLLVTSLASGSGVYGYYGGEGSHTLTFLRTYLTSTRPGPLIENPPLARELGRGPGVLYFASTAPGPPGTFRIDAWLTRPDGQLMSASAARKLLRQLPPSLLTHPARLRNYLHRRGVYPGFGYLPASHYWIVQAIVAAILLLVSLLIAAATIALSGRPSLSLRRSLRAARRPMTRSAWS